MSELGFLMVASGMFEPKEKIWKCPRCGFTLGEGVYIHAVKVNPCKGKKCKGKISEYNHVNK